MGFWSKGKERVAVGTENMDRPREGWGGNGKEVRAAIEKRISHAGNKDTFARGQARILQGSVKEVTGLPSPAEPRFPE